MIKSIIKKAFQFIFMLSIVYAGSFVLMEETSEKTEKTEKSEEALHSSHHSSGFRRTISKNEIFQDESVLVYSDRSNEEYLNGSAKSDFNLEYIYFTSFMRVS